MDLWIEISRSFEFLINECKWYVYLKLVTVCDRIETLYNNLLLGRNK